MPNFSMRRYEADSGVIHPIRLDSATIATTPGNPDVTGNATSDIKVKVSKTAREFGLRPRTVTLMRELSGNSNGKTFTKAFYKTIPILTRATWASNDFKVGNGVTWGGEVWTVIARNSEDY